MVAQLSPPEKTCTARWRTTRRKVDRGDGKVLLTHIVREPADGRFNVAATAEDLLRWMPSRYRTEKPVVHVVSSTRLPEDRLDDGHSRR